MPWLTIRENDCHEVNSPAELNDHLTRIAQEIGAPSPVIASIENLRDHRIEIGLVSDEAFVHITPIIGNPPYWITVGDRSRDGIVDFMSHGQHHAQIECRYLIPAPLASAVVAEFWNTGNFSSSVDWGQI